MTMKRITGAYFLLGAVFATTVAIGLYYHFSADGDRVQWLILPFCMATAAFASITARWQQRFRQSG